MIQSRPLPDRIVELLRCPACQARLRRVEDVFKCTGSGCEAGFPVVDGIPVLIDEASSVFAISDFTSRRSTFFYSHYRFTEAVLRVVPKLERNFRAKANVTRFSRLLLEQGSSPRVLVIGGGIVGDGMEDLVTDPVMDIVETDVSFGPRTQIICDAHDIPFPDDTFDGVVVQAVLEHVVDPYRCVSQIHRVLKPNGLVYAETPFMQQVHGGRYDFTRFTDLGHRRLFRAFDEISRGAVCGPGMALASAYKYFLLSFTEARPLRAAMRLVAAFTGFFLKYFDLFLIDKVAALGAASGLYFLGRKSDQVLSDRDLIQLYRGPR